VYVEGELETGKWQDKANKDRYTTEVVLRPYRGELTMLDGQKQGREPRPRNRCRRRRRMRTSRPATSWKKPPWKSPINGQRRAGKRRTVAKAIPFATGAARGPESKAIVGYDFIIRHEVF
jgi:single-stranded DNA-binding protein